jgi:hypothetical protein
MRRLLIGRRQDNSEAERRPGAGAWIPTRVLGSPIRLGALVTRVSSARRRPLKRIVVPLLRRPAVATWSDVRTAEPEVDLSREWIQVCAYLERTAPESVSADELRQVEDAAAERIYQRSRRGVLASSSPGYFPGSRKRSMPLRRGV